MNKNELIAAANDFVAGFAEAYREVDQKVKSETGLGLTDTLVGAGMSLVVMAKARKHRKAGNWTAALYYLLLWHGYNTNRQHVQRMNKQSDGLVKNMQMQMMNSRSKF